ncbi:1,5-anhydro-D-fructose reductase [Serratia fonticola]|uniref:1,5-anhydro-D-fructose reductase n=1 Tax=Serratia fonticola TaxID=47917 RepID=A0A4U9W865_SERFO|nr:1,5-anhydro-D-fructose reductase [Serratia fonticola]
MIRFAVVGTNWITERFIDAAHESGKMRLTAIYSRKLEQAQAFGANYPVEHFFDSLEALAQSDVIDAVYIASPNSLHCQQSLLFLSHKKHVICEKPLASNLREVEQLGGLRTGKIRWCCLKRSKAPTCPIFLSCNRHCRRLANCVRHLSTIANTPLAIPVTWPVKIRIPSTRTFPTALSWTLAITAWPAPWRCLVRRKRYWLAQHCSIPGVDAHGSVCLNYG